MGAVPLLSPRRGDGPPRALNGRLLVVGLLVLGIGGTVILNLATKGTPHQNLRVRRHPLSGPATPGVPSPVRLIEPCSAVVDFDARFWEPTRATTLRPPAEPATITVAPGHRRAVLVTASGQRVALAPHRGPIVLEACPSPSASR